MNTRLKMIRQQYKMSQEEFGKKIGIESRSHISALEKGNRNITDRIVNDICREFGINEEWLRTGKGEIYQISEDETAKIVSDLLGKSNPFYDIILDITKTYQQLDPKSQKVLQEFANMLLENQHSKKEEN